MGSFGAAGFDSHGAKGFLLVDADDEEPLFESGRSFFSTLKFKFYKQLTMDRIAILACETYVGVAKALFLNSSLSLSSAESMFEN